MRTEADALHSVIDLQAPHKLALKNLEYLAGVLLFQPEPKDILLLGTGGGSMVHFLRFHYPLSNLIALDIDAELLEIMHQKMSLPEAGQQLSYVIDDANHYLRHCSQNFDLILVDVFSGTQSPDWLLEYQTIQRLNSLLSDQGAVAFNLLIDSEHVFTQFYQNLRQVFSNKTLVLPVDGLDNTIAYGLRYRQAGRDMSWYIERATDLGELHDINYMGVLSEIYDTNPTGSGVI